MSGFKTVRNSIKALIVENGKLLFIKMKDSKCAEPFYILPGGGQEHSETFMNALKRECLEELGAQVAVRDFAFIREYIGANHDFKDKHTGFHQVEYMFFCELITPIDFTKATEMDKEQVGIQWISFAELQRKNIYPQVLKQVFDSTGNMTGEIYLGDVN